MEGQRKTHYGVSPTDATVSAGLAVHPALPLSRTATATAALATIRLFWIIVFGGVTGYLVETIYCVVTNGHFEWRGSMMFLPFNAVYGIGALALSVATMSLGRTRNQIYVFLVGALTGTLVEFVCSFVQESLFGSVSWDYSQFPLNIGGRVCLLFSVFWGALAVLWSRAVLPTFEKVYAGFRPGVLKRLTMILAIVLVAAVLLSVLGLVRWRARLDGIPASTSCDAFFDAVFNDGVMAAFYPNMTFVG
jgi:uncharacterized membrane protein